MTVRTVVDRNLGHGIYGEIRKEGAGRSVEVTIFPGARLSRVRTESLDLALRQTSTHYDVQNRRVELTGTTEQERTEVLIYGSGVVVATTIPREGGSEGHLETPSTGSLDTSANRIQSKWDGQVFNRYAITMLEAQDVGVEVEYEQQREGREGDTTRRRVLTLGNVEKAEDYILEILRNAPPLPHEQVLARVAERGVQVDAVRIALLSLEQQHKIRLLDDGSQVELQDSPRD